MSTPDPLDAVNELLAQIANAALPTPQAKPEPEPAPAPVERETTDLTVADVLAAGPPKPREARPPAQPTVAPRPARPARRTRNFEMPEPDPHVTELVEQIRAVGFYGLQEASAYLQFTQKTVISSLRQKGEFPGPAFELACGPVWIRAQLDDFAINYAGQTRLSEEDRAAIVNILQRTPLSNEQDAWLAGIYNVNPKTIAAMRTKIKQENAEAFEPDDLDDDEDDDEDDDDYDDDEDE